MPKEVIFALVLTALFFGALAWLVIYSRRRQHGAARSGQQTLPPGRTPGEVEAARGAASTRAARR